MKITIDTRATSEFQLYLEQGSYDTLTVAIERDGAAVDLSSHTARIYMYNDVEDTSVYTIDSDSTSGAAGEFTFDIAPTDIPSSSQVFKAEIVVSNSSSQDFHRAFGKAYIRKSILNSGASAISGGVSVDYSDFSSFTNVASHGPYRAGTNITFSTNVDGSVAIASSGGGQEDGIVSLVNNQNFIVVSGLSLSFTPTKVVASVMKPTSGDSNIFATICLDSLSSSGFRAELSAKPDSSDYKLSYQIS